MFVRPVPLDLVVDIVNAWSTTVREASDDRSPHPDLRELCHHHAVEPHRSTGDTTIALLADEVHQVFAASSNRIEVLASLVDRLDARAAIAAAGPGWQVPAAAWLRGAVLAGLVEHARSDPHLDRLGTCTAHRCVDAYVDATQASTKRYCSTTCQTRAKAAARRHRLALTDATDR